LYFYPDFKESVSGILSPRKQTRMKKFVVFICSWMLLVIAVAQQKPLLISQEGGKLFLKHTVAPKENWYSIGRLYNLSPNNIASFNGTTINKGLTIAAPLKIPLLAGNFLQSGQPAADEVLVPLYHTVKEKEGLYRIGQLYNKVPTDQIKSWNNLTSDELTNGKNLIVGYLKVKKDLSPLAKGGQVSAPVAVTPKPEPKPVEKPKEPVVKVEEKKEVQPPVVKQEPPVYPKPAPVETKQTGVQSVPGTGGAFKGLFDDQARTGSDQQTINGKAAAFKSTSGWKDGKYYVLMNKTQPGTVVKITNPSNKKFVYAKVLGEIPPIKENEGLMIRISNAAVSELLFGEGEVSWTKQ
jgi:LysM repeat protein